MVLMIFRKHTQFRLLQQSAIDQLINNRGLFLISGGQVWGSKNEVQHGENTSGLQTALFFCFFSSHGVFLGHLFKSINLIFEASIIMTSLSPETTTSIIFTLGVRISTFQFLSGHQHLVHIRTMQNKEKTSFNTFYGENKVNDAIYEKNQFLWLRLFKFSEIYILFNFSSSIKFSF